MAATSGGLVLLAESAREDSICHNNIEASPSFDVNVLTGDHDNSVIGNQFHEVEVVFAASFDDDQLMLEVNETQSDPASQLFSVKGSLFPNTPSKSLPW